MSRLIGTGNNQISTNGMLGGMAFQSPLDVQVEKLQENRFDVVTQSDVGNEPNQVPLNGMLGSMAFMESSSYVRAYEIQNTAAQQYCPGSYIPGNQSESLIFGTIEADVPDNIAWPEDIHLWKIEFNLFTVGSGRNDWYFAKWYNGQNYATVEWNNWILSRTSYSSIPTGWSQQQDASAGYQWGRFLRFCDSTSSVSGRIWVYRGVTSGGSRPGMMWDINYTGGLMGATRAFGSAHSPNVGTTERITAIHINADPDASLGSPGTDQTIYGKVRQIGYRMT